MSMNITTGPATSTSTPTTSTTTPSTTGTTSTTTTTPQQPDYLGLLGGLSVLPFDPNTVINGLLAVDQLPIQNLQTQITNIQTNESIYKSIGTDVANLQSIAFNLTLQSNIQANAATSSNTSAATATANPSAQPGTYNVTVNTLATATTAASTAGIGQALTTANASSTALSALNLGGTPTAGTFSVVVDGKVETVNVDPTKPLIDPPGTTPPQGALSQLQAAIQAGLSDNTATVNVGVSGDKVAISITGGDTTQTHTISFGAAGDSSNFLALMNLTTAQATGTTAGSGLALGSSANVGVASPNATLSQANLATALTGTPDPTSGAATGSFSINGVSISWNAGTDSLNSVIGRINSSSAGVNAQYNSVTDQLVLTNKATGQTAINLADTSGNFLAAMNLAPGTTGAQALGHNASITVNNTTVTSTSNTFTNAAPGLSITALQPGASTTLTVGPDVAGITKQVQSFVDAANKVLNDINTTQQKDATSGTYSSLLGDPTLTGLQNQLLTMITGRVSSSGAYQSLQDLGITTGAVGSVPGSTQTLTLDPTKLAAALTANPGQVAALFNGTTATNGFQGVAQQLNTYLFQQINPNVGAFAQYQSTGDAQIKNLQGQITNLNNYVADQRQVLTAQFQAMATALTQLSAENSLFASMSSSSSSSSTSSSTSSSGS